MREKQTEPPRRGNIRGVSLPPDVLLAFTFGWLERGEHGECFLLCERVRDVAPRGALHDLCGGKIDEEFPEGFA